MTTKTVPAKLEQQLFEVLTQKEQLRQRELALEELLLPYYEKGALFQFLTVYQQTRSNPPWKLIALDLASQFMDTVHMRVWLKRINRDYPKVPCAVTFKLPPASKKKGKKQ